jgi:hypothetical protein
MRPLFLVLAKLTGLLHLFWTLGNLVQMTFYIRVLISPGPDPEATDLLPLISYVLYLLLALVLAWILLMKTEALADKLGIRQNAPEPDLPAPRALLGVGTRLIGLFFTLKALPAIIRMLPEIQQALALGLRLHTQGSILAPLLQLALGLLLAFKADAVVALLNRRPADSLAP